MTIGSDQEKLKMVKTDVFLNLTILNGLGEAAVHGREVGGEGVTCNAPLREARAGRELAIICEGHRSVQKQYLNERG